MNQRDVNALETRLEAEPGRGMAKAGEKAGRSAGHTRKREFWGTRGWGGHGMAKGLLG